MGTAAVQQSANAGANGPNFQSNTDRFVAVGSGPIITQAAAEYQGQMIWHTAGVWSDLWVRVTVNTRSLSATVVGRINGVAGNQTVTIPTVTTGIFHDSVNTDAVSATDILGYVVHSNHSVSVTIGFQISIIQSIFTATAAERVYRATSNFSTGASDGFIPIMGDSGVYPTAAPYQIHVPGGRMRNGSMYAVASSRNGTTTCTLNVNGVDTALVISIPAAGSGWYSDTSNAISVFDRDLCVWNFKLGGTSGLFFFQNQGVDLVTTAFFGGGTRGGAGIELIGSTTVGLKFDSVGPVTGYHTAVLLADEISAQAEALVTDNWEGVIVYVFSNGQSDGTCEFRARKNGADNGHIVTVTALGTGEFESVGSAVALVPTDLISLRRLTNATSATAMLYYTHSLFGPATAPPAVLPALGGIYQLVPGKTDDTIYTGFGPVTTRNVVIP